MATSSGQVTVKRGMKFAAIAIWLSCLFLLLPSPRHWADDAEKLSEYTHGLQKERLAKEGKATPQSLSAAEIVQARRDAWIQWLWLAGTIAIGLVATIFGGRSPKAWAIALVVAVALFVVCRWYFLPSSYSEFFRAVFDEGARSSQVYLITHAPLAYAQLTYYNILAPIILVALAILGALEGRRPTPPSLPSGIGP